MAGRKNAPVTSGPLQVPSVPLDRSASAAYRIVADIDEQIAALKVKRDLQVAKIKAFLGSNEEGTYKGVKVVTWKRSLRSTLSATLVKEKDPELAQACTVTQEVRTFLVVKP